MPYGYFWNRSLPGHDGGMSRLPLRAQTFSELLSLVTSAAMYVHVRPRSETIRCSTPRWYPPRGGGSMADPLRKNSDSSRQGSPPNDGVLVLRFRQSVDSGASCQKSHFRRNRENTTSCAFSTFHAFSLFRDSTGDRRFYKTVERPRRNSVPWFLRLEFYFQNYIFHVNEKIICRLIESSSDDEMSVQIIFSATKNIFMSR